jgi:hypothetical protein
MDGASLKTYPANAWGPDRAFIAGSISDVVGWGRCIRDVARWRDRVVVVLATRGQASTPALQILPGTRHRHGTICDHVEPHPGDVNRFWLGPFQSLCKECHDSTKRFVELHGFRPDIGLDGWPLDLRHPCYRTR